MREPRVTADTLLGGALRVLQPASGYRVNVDALLLAAFAPAGRRSKLALDLGSGVGTIGLVLHALGFAKELALVEREPSLAQIALRNLEELGVPGSVYELELGPSGLPRALVQRADLVVVNPPYFATGSGRARRDPNERGARSGALEPFVRAAALALSGPRARAAFVYPASGLPELLNSATAARLVAKRLRFVHARHDTPARVVLVELRRAKPGGLVVEPPLIEWIGRGQRSPELAAVVDGRFGAEPSRKRAKGEGD